MKRALIVALLGLFVLTGLSAQVQHRLTGPRAKNYAYWRKKKITDEQAVSLNGMIVPGRSATLRRVALPAAATGPAQRITGPRAKNRSVHHHKRAAPKRGVSKYAQRRAPGPEDEFAVE